MTNSVESDVRKEQELKQVNVFIKLHVYIIKLQNLNEASIMYWNRTTQFSDGSISQIWIWQLSNNDNS